MWDQRAYRRHLPHFQNAYRNYFVTFTTLHRRILPPAAREIVLQEVARAHNAIAFIHAGVVMPDHVHLVTQPLWDDAHGLLALSDVLGKIKGRSSRFVNLALSGSGALWLDENFDHQLRSDESIRERSTTFFRIRSAGDYRQRRMSIRGFGDGGWKGKEGRAEARPTLRS